ncbi:MAG: hypothetical protein GC149_15745 [Gammaproteobacteria bacterium]|nr:hypothetical protein [Gammaproteobacteria bacterium]
MGFRVQNSVSSNGTVWRLDNQYSALLSIMMWILIVQMIVPDGFNYNALLTGDLPTSGSAVSRMIWLSLLAGGSLFVLWRAGLGWLLIRCMNPFLLLFIALAIASVAWSIDPALTVRRLVRLVTFVLVCAAFVLSGWHARRFQNVVRPVLTLVLFGSIIFCLGWPTLAIHQETSAELIGAWHGLATQKNGLGALACFGVIFWFHGWLTREVKTLSALFGGGVAATCLVFSRSSTSLVTTIVIMLLLFMLLRLPDYLRSARSFVVSCLVVVILVYALAILKLIPGLSAILEPIMALTGKDMTFTGRTEIWSIISDHIRLHPLLGTGYAAYWTAVPMIGKDSYEFIARMGGFYPGSSHNGYLEVINDLGWIGLICLLGYIFMYVRQSLKLMAIDVNQGALYLALFFQQAITNLSESHWFDVQSVDFVIMTLATLSIARGLLDHQLRLAFGNPITHTHRFVRGVTDRRYNQPAQSPRYKVWAP